MRLCMRPFLQFSALLDWTILLLLPLCLLQLLTRLTLLLWANLLRLLLLPGRVCAADIRLHLRLGNRPAILPCYCMRRPSQLLNLLGCLPRTILLLLPLGLLPLPLRLLLWAGLLLLRMRSVPSSRASRLKGICCLS